MTVAMIFIYQLQFPFYGPNEKYFPFFRITPSISGNHPCQYRHGVSQGDIMKKYAGSVLILFFLFSTALFAGKQAGSVAQIKGKDVTQIRNAGSPLRSVSELRRLHSGMSFLSRFPDAKRGEKQSYFRRYIFFKHG
jgi:hypothetical protein